MEKFLPIFITLFIFTGLPFLFSILFHFKKKIVFNILTLITEVVGIMGSLFIPLLVTLFIAMLSVGKVGVDMSNMITVIIVGFGSSIILTIVKFFVKSPIISYIKWGIYALILILGTLLFVFAPTTSTSSSSITTTALSIFSLLI